MSFICILFSVLGYFLLKQDPVIQQAVQGESQGSSAPKNEIVKRVSDVALFMKTSPHFRKQWEAKKETPIALGNNAAAEKIEPVRDRLNSLILRIGSAQAQDELTGLLLENPYDVEQVLGSYFHGGSSESDPSQYSAHLETLIVAGEIAHAPGMLDLLHEQVENHFLAADQEWFQRYRDVETRGDQLNQLNEEIRLRIGSSRADHSSMDRLPASENSTIEIQ